MRLEMVAFTNKNTALSYCSRNDYEVDPSSVVGALWTPVEGFRINVTIATGPRGSVISLPDRRIHCTTADDEFFHTCSAFFEKDTDVELSAYPNSSVINAEFRGWSGDCIGTDSCILTMTDNKNVTATFGISQVKLAFNATNPTYGIITGSGINCGSDCSEEYEQNTTANFTVTANNGYKMEPIEDALCSYNPAMTFASCQVGPLASDKLVNVKFAITAPPIQKYVLVSSSTPSVIINSSDGAINCGTVCSKHYDKGTVVTLTYTNVPGYVVQWTGACAGSGLTCTLTMDSDKGIGVNLYKIAPVGVTRDKDKSE